MARLAAEGVSLVRDGCAYRDETGSDDCLLLKASRVFGEAAVRHSAAYLGTHGTPPEATIAPFVCGGGFSDTPLSFHGTVLSAENKGNPRTRVGIPLPLPLEDSVNKDASLAHACHAVVAAAQSAKAARDVTSQLPPAVLLGLCADQRASLSAGPSVRNAWVVRAVEEQVSLGRSMGTARQTAPLRLAHAAMAPVDAFRIDVALVNPEKNRIERTNHPPVQPRDPASTAIQNGN
jgi:hypothetical protein